MLAAFGVDVLDPAVSLRRVHVLLHRLPPFARRAGEQWSTEAELLAGLIDHVAYLTWITLRANGAKGAPRPKPFPRPSVARRDRAVAPSRAPAALDEPRKTPSWADAIKQIAAIPGVVVTDDG